MLKFDKAAEIRRLFHREGLSVPEIAERVNSDYKTVVKYLDMDDFGQAFKVRIESEPCSKLNPWKPKIDPWLKEDMNAPGKQRHTELRVFERLREDKPVLPLVRRPGEHLGDSGDS